MPEEYRYCPLCGAGLKVGFIEGKERGFCPNCSFVDYKNPLPVALAIPIKDRSFLLIKRGLAPAKGMWGFPSGFVEAGETSEDACLRELKEETGLTGRIVKLAGVMSVTDREVYGDMLIVAYIVEVEDGELKPSDEVEDIRFFSPEELPQRYQAFLRGLLE